MHNHIPTSMASPCRVSDPGSTIAHDANPANHSTTFMTGCTWSAHRRRGNSHIATPPERNGRKMTSWTPGSMIRSFVWLRSKARALQPVEQGGGQIPLSKTGQDADDALAGHVRTLGQFDRGGDGGT